ncbi:MAG: hypothetical protein WBP26_05985 [Candidatus Saccharimonadales bacterium]
MEGAPFVATETSDERRNEVLDTDDTKDKKNKDKKKKKNAPTIHLPRLDVERPAELAAEKRKNDKKDLLGGVSLSGLGLGPKNETSGKYDTEDSEEKPQPSKQESEEDLYSPAAEAEAILKAVTNEQDTNNNQSIAEEPNREEEVTEISDEIPGQIDEIQHDTTVEMSDGEAEISDDTSAGSAVASTGSGGGWRVPKLASAGTTAPPPVPLPGGTSGSGGGSPGSTGSSTAPPVPPAVPPVLSGAAGGYNVYPVSPVAASNIAPTVKVEQHIIEKHNHFWTGVVVGGLYEHFKHKKREKKLRKELDKQVNVATEGAKKQQQTEEEVRKLRAKQLEQAAEKRWQETHPQPETIAPEGISSSVEHKSASKVGDIMTDNIKTAAEVVATIPLVVSREKSEPFTVYERATPETQKPFAQEASRSQESVLAGALSEDEPPQVDKSRRVETSSWHRMEVDKATGKIVENPSLAYGEAFEAERHQEVKTQASADASNSSGLVAASVGLLGGQAARQTIVQGNGMHGSSDSEAHAPAPVPSRATKHVKQSTSRQAGVGVGLWLLLGVLIALIFIVLR